MIQDRVISLSSFNAAGMTDALPLDSNSPVERNTALFVFDHILSTTKTAPLPQRRKLLTQEKEHIERRLVIARHYREEFLADSPPELKKAVSCAIISAEFLEDALHSMEKPTSRKHRIEYNTIMRAWMMTAQSHYLTTSFANSNIHHVADLQEYFEENPLPPESRFMANLNAFSMLHEVSRSMDELDDETLSQIMSHEVCPIEYWADEKTVMGWDLKAHAAALETRLVDRLRNYSDEIFVVPGARIFVLSDPVL